MLNYPIVYNVRIGYFYIKLLFESHYQIKHLNRICTQIVNYIGGIYDLFKLYLKGVCYDLTYPQIKDLVCHITC